MAEQIAHNRLQQIGVQDGAWHIAGPLAAIGPVPVPDVEIQALGHFAVRLAGLPVPASAWQSRKARDLLKLLAGQLGKSVTREALAAALWPQARAEVALRRLSVLISTVRGVLDPARRHPADRYLVTDPATVRINPAHVALDAPRFQKTALAAIAADSAHFGGVGTRLARRPAGGVPVGDPTAGYDPPEDVDAHLLGQLEAAIAMYTDDFCDDGEFAGDLVERPRAALADLHREAIRRLARRCMHLGRPASAIGWYMRLTAEDSYDESAHLGLIRALSATGRHGEAAQHYREYVARMREIDVEPADFPAPANVSGRLNKS